MAEGTRHELAVDTRGLEKHFGDTRAVDGVDLRIPRGIVYGLLGPNGAGKTTTIRILATLLEPTGGTARVFGHDVVSDANAVRGSVSLTGQFASVDEDLTGRENLVMLGRLLGLGKARAGERADELLAAFGLSEAARRNAKKYSGGMRRRLDIAASLVVMPRLLFLDEPTTGLDPRSRNQVWSIIRALAAAGTSILLTTQHLDEADQLADRIAVIDHGKVIAEGTAAELKASVGTGSLEIRVVDEPSRDAAANALRHTLGDEAEIVSERDRVTALVGDATMAAGAVQACIAAGIEPTAFSLGQPSLDEVFLALTDGSADGTAGPVAAASAEEGTR